VLRQLRTAAAAHGAATLVAHAGQSVAGTVLSSLAVTEQYRRYEQERKCYGQGQDKSCHNGKVITFALGACPRTDIFSQIKAFQKNKHSHISDIASIIFLK